MKISEAKRQVMLQQWTELIKEQKASGMKVNAWCKERGIGTGVTIKHKNKSCSWHRFFPWGMTPFRSLAGTQCMVDGTKEVGT